MGSNPGYLFKSFLICQFYLPMIGSSDDLELFLEIVDKVGLQPFDGKLLGGNDNNVCGAIC